ncbi:MAG TPA: SDR family NAD(P)-dependent oxidoreductase [Albitalea sp.]|nr:SDR family NAD(P)-dependent oxidoreductase [Albitalea sp.]
MNAPTHSTLGTQRELAVVTGATGMLGRATALALAARGAQLVLVARDRAKGERLLRELEREAVGGHHRLVIGNLASQADVRRIAAEINEPQAAIRALVHTAAALTPSREETADGYETMFATNVLSRLLLTHALRPALARASKPRVAWVTGPSPDRLDFDDLMARRRYRTFMQFRATNAANLMLAFTAARAWRDGGLASFAYHPGILQSDLMKGMPAPVRLLTSPFGRDPRPAAEALADLVWGAHGDEINGAFFKHARAIKPPAASANEAQQSRLWIEAHRLLGITASAA